MRGNDSHYSKLKQLLDKRTIAAIFLPAIIVQSVTIGGGFSTGREAMSYHAKFGTLGIVAVAATMLFCIVVLPMIFEFGRRTNSHNYRKFTENLLGKGWPIFEVLYIILAMVAIGAVVDAGGNIIETIMGFPRLAVNVSIIAVVSGILYFGREFIEKISTYGTFLLYLTFIIMFSIVMLSRWEHIVEVIAGTTTSYVANATVSDAIRSGIVYGGLCIPFWIPALFTVDRLKNRKEAIFAGVASAFLFGIPLLLSYLSFMGYYPNEEIIAAAVPWLQILQQFDVTALLILYGIIVGWTLVETSVGLVHSITDRIDNSVSNANIAYVNEKNGLANWERGIIASAILVGAGLLSRYGIITLVNQAYSMLATGFLIVFVVPLLAYYIRSFVDRTQTPTESSSD